MRIDGLTHPKTKELAFKLDVSLPHAVGLLEFLWAFVGRQTPRGNIGRWSNAVIASEAQWHGDPDKFVDALVEVRYLDTDDEHRLVVHDWNDHLPNWVRAKLKSMGEEVLSQTLRGDYKGREGKRSEGKGGSGRKRPIPADFVLDDGLVEYARERHLDPKTEVEKFRVFHKAKGSKFADWRSAFQKWCIKAVEFREKDKPRGELGRLEE